MLQLFTDTDTDITPELAAKYGYRLISMPFSIDGETYYPYETEATFDFHRFYDRLRGGVLPTTSAIPKERYLEYFEPVFARGDDILYVHFSAAMTMTFDNMKQAVEELREKYPARKFFAVDTKAITTLSLNIVLEIGELYLAGKTAGEIVAWAEKEVDHFAILFFADDLKFFRRSGRVGGLAATMGTLIGIRPIIHMNEEGKMVSIGKERGRLAAMERLLSGVKEYGKDLKSHRVLIGHTDAPELAEELAGMLRAEFGEDLPIMVCPANPTAGSHCGPNGVGVSFYAEHR